ncbi:hypothetical protein B484DRAFT_6994 [Ochromonadaceae sp. CCMP2298]|nr:hypothetical protein B484DRAFT_6994 [Ochromonadaceae sp. CCMP2298]
MDVDAHEVQDVQVVQDSDEETLPQMGQGQGQGQARDVWPLAEEKRFLKKLGRDRRSLFEDIAVVKCKVPMQANGFDCGVFVYKFAEQVLLQTPPSTYKDIRSSFSQALPITHFDQGDVDKERDIMLDMIAE